MAPSPHLLGDIVLDGKIVLITGAGSGINLAFAKTAHQQGARVLIADLKLTPDAEAFVRSALESVVFKQTDVANWQQLRDLFPFSLEKFNDVPDIVVPGAGLFEPPLSNFWEDTEDERYTLLDVNVGHVIKLTRLAIRALVSRQKKGVVCSVASGAGLQGYYATPMYNASKHAVVGFTRSMAPAERLEGIKVCTVCPGVVDTPLWDDRRELYGLDKIPDGSLTTAEQVAELMVKIITSGKYGGGTVMQTVTGTAPRVVPTWNIPAPTDGMAAVDGIMDGDTADVHPLFQPSHDIINNERGQPWP